MVASTTNIETTVITDALIAINNAHIINIAKRPSSNDFCNSLICRWILLANPKLMFVRKLSLNCGEPFNEFNAVLTCSSSLITSKPSTPVIPIDTAG